MKNTSRKPYIYKVTNLETGQYYIGSQCIGKIIGVNYFTSSTNKNFMDDFKNYREEKYKIEIIKEFEDPKECGRVENYMIMDHMQLKDGLCLNRACCCCSGEKIFSTVGTHHSEKTKQKISISKKGFHNSEDARKKMSAAHKGQTHSEETRKRISEGHKGQPAWNKGIPMSEEHKKKLSISLKGRNKGTHLDEETRKKISIAHKRKISIEGVVFDSLTEASKYYNVVVSTISCWIENKKHNAFYIEKCPEI